MSKVTYDENRHSERLARSFREVNLIIKNAWKNYDTDMQSAGISFIDYIKLVNDNVTRESVALSIDAK